MTFGERQLFTNVSFNLLDRELLFVRGPSGGGKSRLFRAIAQLDHQFTGQIFLQVSPTTSSETAFTLSVV